MAQNGQSGQNGMHPQSAADLLRQAIAHKYVQQRFPCHPPCTLYRVFLNRLRSGETPWRFFLCGGVQNSPSHARRSPLENLIFNFHFWRQASTHAAVFKTTAPSLLVRRRPHQCRLCLRVSKLRCHHVTPL